MVLKLVVANMRTISRTSSEFEPITETSLAGQLKATINRPEYSDFALIAQGKKILVHKVILACRSNFFKKLFENNKARYNNCS
jgi:hypothetical protein